MWVIDFDASGLDEESYPISVGLYNGEKSFYLLIKPDSSWQHWDNKAELIHKLTRQKLNTEGATIYNVASTLNNILNNETVYCDALDWDSFWCQRLFNTAEVKQCFTIAGIQEFFADTPRLITQFYVEKQRNSTQTELQLHHARDDAIMIWQAFNKAIDNL